MFFLFQMFVLRSTPNHILLEYSSPIFLCQQRIGPRKHAETHVSCAKRLGGNRMDVVGSILKHSNHNLVQNSNVLGHMFLVREGGP